jgi:hypothetical protein
MNLLTTGVLFLMSVPWYIWAGAAIIAPLVIWQGYQQTRGRR